MMDIIYIDSPNDEWPLHIKEIYSLCSEYDKKDFECLEEQNKIQKKEAILDSVVFVEKVNYIFRIYVIYKFQFYFKTIFLLFLPPFLHGGSVSYNRTILNSFSLLFLNV